MKQMKRVILNSDVVSFDIFDTLICRNCSSYTDIFDIVENRYNLIAENKISNFKECRLRASKLAKAELMYEEVTYDEIYDFLDCDCDKSLLKKLEYEIELDYCVCNNLVKELYDFAKQNNKKIICVSDMYFDSNKLKDILYKCGYEIDDVYVSCDFRMKKSTGKLFKKIIELPSLKGKKIVHFGDAEKGDFLFPKKYGIKTFLIQNKSSFNFIKKKKVDLSNLYNKIIVSTINNSKKSSDSDSCYNFGYEIVGPICLYFCLWLKKNSSVDSLSLFCARDMEMIQKIYNILFPEIDSRYFFVSRKSLRLPYLYKKNTFESFCDSLTKNKLTISEVLENLNLLDDEVINYLNKVNFDNKKYTKEELIKSDKFEKLYNEILKNKIDKYGKDQYNYLKKYLKSFGVKKYNLVDMGWKGTTQSLLANIYPEFNFKGFYFGVDKESKYDEVNSETSNAYLFYKDYEVLDNLQFKIYSCRDLFEKIFASQHGSTVKYCCNNPYYVLDSIVSNDSVRVKIQDGAVMFANDILKYIDDFLLCDGMQFDFVELLTDYLTNPNLNIARLFGEIINDNMYQRCMASPKSKINYLLHFNELKKDFGDSGWKIGFMKRFFYIKFPYYSLYKFLFERKKDK